MNRKGTGCILICFLFLFVSISARSQSVDFGKEIRFIQYLIDKEQYPEADFLLSRIDTKTLQPAQIDTVHYLRGWSAYTNKRLDTAIQSLSLVSQTFPLYNKSHFFSAYSAVFVGKRDTAKILLNEIGRQDSIVNEMRSFQLSGIALLDRDYTRYQELKRDFTNSLFALQKEEARFEYYYDALKKYRRRSPLLAGVYSAILPGAGKFYAGKKKQGIAAFLPILSLGVVTYESYRKSGIKSARTIAFGSLFSVFYIGNIWGSVVSVKIKEQEYYRGYDNKILFDMHIPLRNLYN